MLGGKKAVLPFSSDIFSDISSDMWRTLKQLFTI
jgi:hypothetical protein